MAPASSSIDAGLAPQTQFASVQEPELESWSTGWPPDLAACANKAGESEIGRATAISSRSEECLAIQQEIVAQAHAYAFGERALLQIQVALEEALTNAVCHGNGLDPTRKVFIEYRVDSGGLHVKIADEGAGFNPANIPNPTLPENLERPHGRGLLLMRQFMTGVRFNQPGNLVEMWRLKDDPK